MPYTDREAKLAHGRAYYRANREKNREKQRLQSLKWMQENADKAREYNREYCQANKPLRAAYRAKRRAAEIRRTPKWDAELTEFAVLEATDLAAKREQATGFPWEVDHTIPLQGKTVSGLHVWNNLQVIPRCANRSKGNKFEG